MISHEALHAPVQRQLRQRHARAIHSFFSRKWSLSPADNNKMFHSFVHTALEMQPQHTHTQTYMFTDTASDNPVKRKSKSHCRSVAKVDNRTEETRKETDEKAAIVDCLQYKKKSTSSGNPHYQERNQNHDGDPEGNGRFTATKTKEENGKKSSNAVRLLLHHHHHEHAFRT